MTFFEILENPFAFSIITALVAGIITFAYMKTIEEDSEVINKSTFKVAFIVFVVNLIFMFTMKTSIGTEPVLTEPYGR
jgi:xanthine/uracil/vitamin C permease (AzgA family)